MARRHDRCRRGERLRAGVPFGYWKTTTFTAGLRCIGMVAPWVLDGPMNADAFLTYVTRVLVPELGRGDVVIMDNLSSHKAPAVRATPSKRLAPGSCSSRPTAPTSTPSSRPSPS